jgi:formate--tetrahydrofolate ligase
VRSVYSSDNSLTEKIRLVAQKIYGAADVNLSERAKAKLAEFARWGYDQLRVCIAKTQYSLSDNRNFSARPPTGPCK